MMRRRILFWVGALMILVGLIVFFGVRRDRTPAAAPASSTAKHRPLFFPAVPNEGKSDEARGDEVAAAEAPAIPPSSPLQRDSKEYAREISEKTEFKAFASSENLTPEQQQQVSHIVALYYMDDESLKNSTSDEVKLASMRCQLLMHMHIRVRRKIPDKWDAFERTNLLPPVTEAPKNPS